MAELLVHKQERERERERDLKSFSLPNRDTVANSHPFTYKTRMSQVKYNNAKP